jgi:hypothetical protein
VFPRCGLNSVTEVSPHGGKYENQYDRYNHMSVLSAADRDRVFCHPEIRYFCVWERRGAGGSDGGKTAPAGTLVSSPEIFQKRQPKMEERSDIPPEDAYN